MMSTLPSCMDRYMNRYMVPPATPTHHHLPSHQTPPVGQPYFHQNVGGGNGAGVVAPPGQPGQPGQTNTGGAFMMNCYQNANGWTGVPLISTACRRPRKQQQQQHHSMPPANKPPPPTGPASAASAVNGGVCDYDENAMSRLAIHAHGAPLILTGRGYHRKPPLVRHPQPMQKIPSQPCFTPAARMDEFGGNVYENGHRQLGQQQQQQQQPHPLDTFSMVNSDESSSTSSSNSHTPDTCLPRIIKPRKRRKKERKPNTCQNPNVTSMGSMPVKNNCTNANNGVSLMKSLPLVTSTATQTTTIQELADKMPVMGMMSAQDEPQFADLGDLGDPGIGMNGVDETTEEMSSCSCRLCDPFCRIWAFPLRRSCSDNSGEVEATRRNVGVIGSHIKSSSTNEWRSTPQLCNQQQIYGTTATTNIDGSRKGSLSDSGDSGCDLLSGLNFAPDDLLNIADNADGGGKNVPNSDRVCDFLLTDDCWEILSRRVMESLDLRGDDNPTALERPAGAKVQPSGSDCVSDSGSVFSDDGQAPHLGVQIANLLLDSHQPQLPIFSGCFTTQQFGGAQMPTPNPFGDSTPLYIQEKDRGNEILSCIDMVWNGAPQLMPVEE